VTRAELAAALREHAYLEGDFLLRSGKRSRYYLDKYRFETRPELLRELGKRIVALVRDHDPHAVRLAAPELGAVTLAAASALESGLPFLIVRGSAKDYGTMNRIEGAYEAGDRVCVIEDVVTTAGALVEAVDALREAGLTVQTAICVVDREQGGHEALGGQGVELQPIFRVSELLETPKSAANPHG
jgi:orotate phosphoribosyltransferase